MIGDIPQLVRVALSVSERIAHFPPSHPTRHAKTLCFDFLINDSDFDCSTGQR